MHFQSPASWLEPSLETLAPRPALAKSLLCSFSFFLARAAPTTSDIPGIINVLLRIGGGFGTSSDDAAPSPISLLDEACKLLYDEACKLLYEDACVPDLILPY